MKISSPLMFEMGALDSLHDAHRSVTSALSEYEAVRGCAMVNATPPEEMTKRARKAARAAIVQLRDFVSVITESDKDSAVIRKVILICLAKHGRQTAWSCLIYMKSYSICSLITVTQQKVMNELERLVDMGAVQCDMEGYYEL